MPYYLLLKSVCWANLKFHSTADSECVHYGNFVHNLNTLRSFKVQQVFTLCTNLNITKHSLLVLEFHTLSKM